MHRLQAFRKHVGRFAATVLLVFPINFIGFKTKKLSPARAGGSPSPSVAPERILGRCGQSARMYAEIPQKAQLLTPES